jgi:ribosomal protein L32E
MVEKKKPKFLRKDWHKKIKLGSSVKKTRKWRAAKGRHNKIRLNRKGHLQRPKIGWSSGRMNDVMRIMNVEELSKVDKKNGIIIGSVGIKKRKDIIAKANEMKIKILNKYKENKNESK